MSDLYSTSYLVGVIEGLPPAPMSLLRRYFPSVIEEDSEEIHFDKSIRNRLMAPFVAPVVEGQIVEERGSTTEIFRPAYVKPKTPLDPRGALKRVPGEARGGSMSAADRQRLRVANTMADHRNYIERRLEWMAAQALRTGAVTVSGEKYPTQVVSFGRAAGLTVTLAGTDVWTDAASTPVDDLHAWNVLALQQPDGAPLTEFVMDPDALSAFRAHADVKDVLDTRRGSDSTFNMTGLQEGELQWVGRIDQFNIFTYQAWYESTIGSLQPFLPSGTVIGLNPVQLEGVQQFGAILDVDSLQAMRYFPKSWVEQDPSRRFVMTQSAPLIVPARPNATVGASVL